jgi:hypothetical protein
MTPKTPNKRLGFGCTDTASMITPANMTIVTTVIGEMKRLISCGAKGITGLVFFMRAFLLR